MMTVHLRVADSDTRMPTPVRINITDQTGRVFVPLGHVPVFSIMPGESHAGHLKLAGVVWCVIDGMCEIPLPTQTPLTIRIEKGPEFRPVEKTITLGPGQMAVRLEIERILDATTRGWITCDSRCHELSPGEVALEAAAEGLHLVQLQARVRYELSQDGNTYPTLRNLALFSGQSPATLTTESQVVVNTWNQHRVLGSLSLLHAHRVVHPLVFGSPDDSDDWSLLDWCDQCHRKRGLTIWTRAFEGTSPQQHSGEALVAALLGKIDAIEFDPQTLQQQASALKWLYRYWSAGIKLALVGGSAKDSSKIALGTLRTYALAANPEQPALPLHEAWIEAVRAGRTYASSGPQLEFHLGDCQPGDTLEGRGPLRYRATAQSRTPFLQLELVHCGKVVASSLAQSNELHLAELAGEIDPQMPGWWAIRCVGPKGTFAHSSPIWSRTKNPLSEENRQAFLAVLDGVQEWCTTLATYRDLKWQRQLLQNLDEARKRLTPS